MAPVLGYWNLRGLCEPIRYLLYYLGEDFEDKRYCFNESPPYDLGEWSEDKKNLGFDFPNLPYLQDGELKFTQTLAIIRYLARKHGLAGNNELETVTLDMVEQQARDLQLSLVNICYAQNYNTMKPAYILGLPGKLFVFDKFLEGKLYVLGSKITYVDFLLYEALDQHRFLVPDCLEKFVNLNEFAKRIETLPNLHMYMQSDIYKRWPFFAPFSWFGGRGEAPR